MIVIYVVVLVEPNEEPITDLFEIYGYSDYPTALMPFPVLERLYYEHLSNKYDK